MKSNMSNEVNNVTMQLFLEKNWLEKQKRLYIFLKKANSKGRYTPHYLMIQPKSTHVQKHFCFDVDSKLFKINCNISVGKAMEERGLLQVATRSLLPRWSFFGNSQNFARQHLDYGLSLRTNSSVYYPTNIYCISSNKHQTSNKCCPLKRAAPLTLRSE